MITWSIQIILTIIIFCIIFLSYKLLRERSKTMQNNNNIDFESVFKTFWNYWFISGNTASVTLSRNRIWNTISNRKHYFLSINLKTIYIVLNLNGLAQRWCRVPHAIAEMWRRRGSRNIIALPVSQFMQARQSKGNAGVKGGKPGCLMVDEQRFKASFEPFRADRRQSNSAWRQSKHNNTQPVRSKCLM